MSRTVERLDGLALLGSASLGPIELGVPALLESIPGGTATDRLSVRSRPGRRGGRHLAITRGEHELDLRFPVLAPEVAGTESGVHAVGERAYLLHYPFVEAEATSLRASRPELVVLGNARALWNEGAPFVHALRAVRQAVGASPLLWAPRVALPHRVPFLVYAGVDLVDTTEGVIRSAEGQYLDPTLGVLDAASARREGACDCPACSVDPAGPLADHALALYRRAMAETRAAARSGRLRELVEARLPAEPALAELLRHTDRELAGPLETRTPVVGTTTRPYVLAEAHRRPEMVRFRERLVERYRPPPSKTVLLLVPCSKTKPYRRSRSHRRFQGALEGLPSLERVHFVSVSSPIGLVPRELEDVAPARHYDIPVTGDWSEPERETVLRSLARMVNEGQYRSIIAHLDAEEYGFVKERLEGAARPVAWTVPDDRTTSTEALGRLRRAASTFLEGTSVVPGGPLAVVREELQELASVQFGRAVAERLFAPPVRLAGRPWFQRLTDGSSDLATVREERGIFHLTVAGARRIGPPFPLAVEVDPTLPLTGDLFVPGVRGADPSIRAGDSVTLLRGGELAGVGEAVLPGPLMTQLERGLAVKVRHRVHRPTDTPMTGEESPPEGGPVVQR